MNWICDRSDRWDWQTRHLAPAHRIVASCSASAQARSYSSRLIHSSIVCGSFWPAPKVTVGTPWRTIQFASSPPLAARMVGLAADVSDRRDRALDHGQALLHPKWIIVGLGLELDAACLAVAVLDARC